jgi:biotin operon repressor
MPRKKSDKTYGEKLIWLFAELYFTGKSRSLIDLAGQMECSRQAVMRMVDHISQAYVPIEETREGRRSYYRIPRPDRLPKALSMSPSDKMRKMVSFEASASMC